jgi:hypothetical protein
MEKATVDLMAEVRRLEARVEADPDDGTAREQLVRQLLDSSVQLRSMTRDGLSVITSRPQLEFCAYAARRVLEVGAGGEDVQLFAERLRDEVRDGERWEWRHRRSDGVLLAAVVLISFLFVVLGGSAGNVVIVALFSLASTAFVAWWVLMFRRQRWWIRARQVSAFIRRSGI